MDILIDSLWYENKHKSDDDIISKLHQAFPQLSKTYLTFKVATLNSDYETSVFLQDLKTTHDKLHKDMIEKRVYNLIIKTYHAQGTQAWLDDRKKCITASTAGELLSLSKYTTRQQSIKNKCGYGPIFKGNKYTEHGTKYEDVAAMLYQSMNLIDLHFLGLVRHKNKSIPIGASPDGILANGRMLEIKVPMCRQITGEVPVTYEVQTQMQMEVCELYECDFYENRIVEYDFEEEYYEDGEDRHTSSGEIKGMIGQFFNKTTDKDVWVYPPMWCTSAEMETWIKNQIDVMKREEPGLTFDTVLYWRLEKESCVRIQRDHDRMHNQYIPEFKKAWKEIQHHLETNGVELKDPVSDDEDESEPVIECVFDSDSD